MTETVGKQTDTSLQTFVAANREEIIRRCQEMIAMRLDPAPTTREIEQGIPLFLDNLIADLGDAAPKNGQLLRDSMTHGKNQFLNGFTISQVVHDYGAVCQSVTGVAVDLAASISAEDFRTLNRCLDDAIAGAVTEFARHQVNASDDAALSKTLLLQNLVFTATTAFNALRTGNVGVTGATGDLLQRTLVAMHAFVAAR